MRSCYFFMLIASDLKRLCKRVLQIKQIKTLKMFCLGNINTKPLYFLKELFQSKQWQCSGSESIPCVLLSPSSGSPEHAGLQLVLQTKQTQKLWLS